MSHLDPRLLLQGYASGIFPMADSRDASELFWVEPRTRAIGYPVERYKIVAVMLSGVFAGLAGVFAAQALRGGAYLHPRHNWFVSAAMTGDDLALVLEATDQAFAAVRKHLSQ